MFCATKVHFFSQLKWFLISQFGGPKNSTTTRAAVGIMASKIRVLLRSSLSGERGYWFTLRPDAKAWRCCDGDVTHPSLSTGNNSSATWFHGFIYIYKIKIYNIDIEQKLGKHDLGSNNVGFTNTSGGLHYPSLDATPGFTTRNGVFNLVWVKSWG